MKRIKKHIGTHHVDTPWKFILVFGIIFLGAFGISYSVKAYPEIFMTRITANKIADIRPAEPIVLEFSFPVLTETYAAGVRTDPASDFNLRWEQSNRKLSLVPKTFWRPETDYKVILPEGKNAMLAEIPSQTIVFSTERYPQISEIYPVNGAQSVVFDAEDPIVVNFSGNARDFSFRFELDSGNALAVDSNLNKTRFKILPVENLDYSKDYRVKIYAKYAYDSAGEYKKISESRFTTQPPPDISWDQDYQVRLEQARKYTVPKIKNGKYIDINLTAQVMGIFENGRMLDDYMVSSGKPGMSTPKGETQIYNKAPRAWSAEYGLYMPYWMAMASDGKFGIHELPEWPGGYKEGAAHLGTPVSHGCVRLGVGAAKRVYEWADIGTPVVIY